MPLPTVCHPRGEDVPEGRVTGNQDGLTLAERAFANEMRDLGNHVEVLRRVAPAARRTSGSTVSCTS